MRQQQERCLRETQNKGKKGSAICSRFTLFTHFLKKSLHIFTGMLKSFHLAEQQPIGRGLKAVVNEEAYLSNPFRPSTSCASTHIQQFTATEQSDMKETYSTCSTLTPTRTFCENSAGEEGYGRGSRMK